MEQYPPGWYPDPTDPQRERLWDGSEWVDKTRSTLRRAVGSASPTTGVVQRPLVPNSNTQRNVVEAGKQPTKASTWAVLVVLVLVVAGIAAWRPLSQFVKEYGPIRNNGAAEAACIEQRGTWNRDDQRCDYPVNLLPLLVPENNDAAEAACIGRGGSWSRPTYVGGTGWCYGP